LKTSIVILNYNGKKHLKRFLPSVIRHCPDFAEVVVADNGSSDGSVEFLEDEFPEVRLILLEKNFGFAGGYNHALKALDAEIYVLLNSDVEVSENWLEPLISKLGVHPEITACQPKIRAVDRRDHFEHAGASGGFIDKYNYPFCRGRIFDHCERDIGQHDDPREVFWATGACLVIRAEAFHQAGGFDESLFAHMEEIDLCWRLKNRGHRIYCFPESTVYHLGGGTLAVQNPGKTYLNFRNNLSMIVKNDFREGFVGRLFKRLLMDGAGAFYLLFTSGPTHFFAVFKAHLHFYGSLNQLLRERRLLKANSRGVNETGRYRASIVTAYFRQKKRVFGALGSNLFVRQNRSA
jgi:hypothetical protein